MTSEWLITVTLLADSTATEIATDSTANGVATSDAATNAPRVTATPKSVSEQIVATATAVATNSADATAVPPTALTTPVPPATAQLTSVPTSVGTVIYYEEQITLPTYPFEPYQTNVIDPIYQWPYKRFDMDRFRTEAPTPEPRTYRLLVLENAYLKVSVLPALGGRIWQVIHKPSGMPIFYQNTVVKPTHWGSAQQLGWLGLGGLEWGLPVVEHGYDWGVPWEYQLRQPSQDRASITVFTPNDGRLLKASITITVRAEVAGFELAPAITNLADHQLAFSYWHDAMLAPGPENRPSASLEFILPTDTMTVHSTNDATMPPSGQPFSWPLYQQRNRARLATYTQYLGFFEAPAAQGPFVAVYDPTYDVGIVRSYPAAIARGSKVFVLGWQDALASSNFTDDDSAYIELHGGLAPTFDDQYRLPAQGQITWRETWYPVTGIGTISYANASAAVQVSVDDNQVNVGVYPTQPVDGTIILLAGTITDSEMKQGNQAGKDAPILDTVPFQARPDLPFQGHLTRGVDSNKNITLQLRDSTGRPFLSYAIEVK